MAKQTIGQKAEARLRSFDGRGVKRGPLKTKLRDEAVERGDERPWSVSTGLIHSDCTHAAYGRVVRTYARWARDKHGINDLDELDRRAPYMVAGYLEEMRDTPIVSKTTGEERARSAWSLAQYRAALRMYHTGRVEASRGLGEEVKLPVRARSNIRNNRHTDLSLGGHINIEKHAQAIEFLRCTGLREREIRALWGKRVHVERDAEGKAHVTIDVRNGKGGKARQVIPLGDHEWIATHVETCGRNQAIFPNLPKNLQIHVLRRQFAQAMYAKLSGLDLPAPEGRLKAGSYDEDAALKVSNALGHSRINVVLTHYLR